MPTHVTNPNMQQDETPGAPAKTGAFSDQAKAAELGRQIGRELRAMFDGVIAEPVPDRFRELLDALEKKQPKD